jgi:D-xylose transport system substrate-binding protein
MRFALFRLNASVMLATVSAAALGALGWAAAFAQNATPSVSAGSFNRDFSEMAKLKPLASQGKGKIGVLLPETTTSARYTSFDEPYLKEAFAKAGLPADDLIITNAQGSESNEMTRRNRTSPRARRSW